MFFAEELEDGNARLAGGIVEVVPVRADDLDEVLQRLGVVAALQGLHGAPEERSHWRLRELFRRAQLQERRQGAGGFGKLLVW
jgi:hypothetical protein